MTVLRSVACGLLATIAMSAAIARAQQPADSSPTGQLILASYGGVAGATIGRPAGDAGGPRLLGGNRLLNVAADVVSVSPDGRYVLLSSRDPFGRPEPIVSPDARSRRDKERMLRPYTGDAFARPVVLHQLATGKATKLKNLGIVCAAWAPDSHAFSFVSADGIGVFNVARAKRTKIEPAVRRKYATTASVSAETVSTYAGSTDVFARQECGPWIDNDSFAYRTMVRKFPRFFDDLNTLRWPSDRLTAERLDTQFGSDSGVVVTLGTSPRPIELGDVTILNVSPDGTRVLASRATGEDGVETFVGRLLLEGVVVDAVVPPALSDCRMTAASGDLVCLRLEDVHPNISVVAGSSFAETANLSVPGLRDWLWIGDGRALVLQVSSDNKNSVAVADVDRGTLIPIIDHAQLTDLARDLSGLRLVHWIAAR